MDIFSGIEMMPAFLFLNGVSVWIDIIKANIIIAPMAVLIFLTAGIFISSAIVHIVVYIAGGKKGIKQTIKALMYGSTPRLLFGWIPLPILKTEANISAM